jgi:hypothetical protein
MMNKREFNKYLKRDQGRCYHCGITDDTLVPQHRQGRGMGGSKLRDVPSNIITFCSDFNQRIEDNHISSLKAKRMGWKLESWEDPQTTPVLDMSSQEWFLLSDDYTREITQIG